MSIPTFVDVLRTEVAMLQAAHPERLGEIARAQASIVEGHVVPVDLAAGEGKVLSRNSHQWYAVNGRCSCTAAEFGKPCRHLSAWKLYKHVSKKYAELQPAAAPAPPEPVSGIDARYVVHIQGEPFVRFAGLLQMAHERGLVRLEAAWTYNDGDLSLAKAVAIFEDGRRFEECGDATPANVNRKVAPHFRRVALTRSKARVLRDALGIDLVALEELEEEGAS